MNKKFSTLVAGLLLAGGAFSNAYAVDFSKVAGNGKYYKILRTAYWGPEGSLNKQWVKDDEGKYFLSQKGLTNAKEDFYRIDKTIDGKYFLTALDGSSFTVKEGDLTYQVFASNESTIETFKLEGQTRLYIDEAKDLMVGNGDGGESIWPIAICDRYAKAQSGDYGNAYSAEATSLVTLNGLWLQNGTVGSFSYVDNTDKILFVGGDNSSAKNIWTASYNSETNIVSFKNNECTTLNIEGYTSFEVIRVNYGFILKANGADKYITVTSGKFVVADKLEEATILAILNAAEVELTAGELNFYEKDGFSVTVKGLNETTDKWTVDLQNNPLVGHLTPMKFNAKQDGFEAADADDVRFLLKNADGDYIVMSKVLGEGSWQKAYELKTVSKEALLRDLKKVGEQKLNPYFTFKYSKKEAVTEITTITAISVYDYNNNYAAEVGRFDFQDVAYLGAANYNLQLMPIQIKLGSDLIANWRDVLAPKFFTVEDVTANAARGFKVVESCGVSGWSKNVDNVLEKQWALTFDGEYYVFTNRENQGVRYTLPNALYKTDKEHTYRVSVIETNTGEPKSLTLVIKPVDTKATDGYMTLADVKNHKFNIGYWSTGFEGNIWFTENHTTDHTIGLDKDVEDASVWTATEFSAPYTYKGEDASYDDVYTKSDSIYVISKLGFYNADPAVKDHDVKLDTLKVVSYSFVNEYNEGLVFDKEANKYVADKTKKLTAQKFALRENNGHLNLRLVQDFTAQEEVAYPCGHQVFGEFNEKDCATKMYAGDAANGILSNTNLYERTENDLFDVVATEKPMYRRVVNALDTISIFRDNNANEYLYEQGKFLGLENIKDEKFDKMEPAMVADTAYVRYETYRPQYMLVVDAKVTEPSEVLCPICGQASCEHSKATTSVVEGRYLVNLVDTAYAWHKANKHNANNPYVNTEKYYRLGFVQATHRNDSLIIAQDNNRLFVGDNDFNQAKFAFRYVDQEAGSFVIETANYKKLGESDKVKRDGEGYVKWMNGVVVVVDNIKDAEVYNMNEDEHRNPTANEEVAVSEVSVVAVDGAVVVKGAAGKTVAISNILGQTIANTVIASDNETIAVPAGIVVVAVEGEEAVKAIVR